MTIFLPRTGINYRKSVIPSNCFPASLYDTLVGYLYVLNTLGFDPKNVLILGESAGGNAALALMTLIGKFQESNGSQPEGHLLEHVQSPRGLILLAVSRGLNLQIDCWIRPLISCERDGSHKPWSDMTESGASHVENDAIVSDPIFPSAGYQCDSCPLSLHCPRIPFPVLSILL